MLQAAALRDQTLISFGLFLASPGMPDQIQLKWKEPFQVGFPALAKNFCNHLTHFINICNLFFICTLGMQSNAWPNPIKMTKSDCSFYRGLTCMSKNQYNHSILSRNFALKRILQSDWTRIFWSIIQEQEFCRVWSLSWKTKNKMFHSRLSGESN